MVGSHFCGIQGRDEINCTAMIGTGLAADATSAWLRRTATPFDRVPDGSASEQLS